MSKPKQSSSAYDAFASVDQMVSKTVFGSDGAASWQKFRQETKELANHQSVAPGLQVKRNDRLGSGLSSLEQERQHERDVRKEAGHADCECLCFRRENVGRTFCSVAEYLLEQALNLLHRICFSEFWVQ